MVAYGFSSLQQHVGVLAVEGLGRSPSGQLPQFLWRWFVRVARQLTFPAKPLAAAALPYAIGFTFARPRGGQLGLRSLQYLPRHGVARRGV